MGSMHTGLEDGNQHNRLAAYFRERARGEVGLIFAAIGKSLGVMDDALFSAVVLMVIVTTLLSPPLFKYCLRRCD